MATIVRLSFNLGVPAALYPHPRLNNDKVGLGLGVMFLFDIYYIKSSNTESQSNQ